MTFAVSLGLAAAPGVVKLSTFIEAGAPFRSISAA
jgi:hypothetical protein